MATFNTFASASEIDVVKVTERENSGVQALFFSRLTIGYILSGAKYIHHNDSCTAIREGDIFLLCAGHHYIENTVGESGRYEQITFYLSPTTLQQVIFGLNINYGVSFASSHSCSRCLGQNFVATAASVPLRNFFVGINISLRNSGLLHNDIGQRIKLNELIFLMLSSTDGCIRRKMLRSADAATEQFMSVIYKSIFVERSIESLAAETNRSPTAFKKEFRRVFAASPHRWIIEQRLMRAKIMLASTNSTVSEVGIECGFTNISHFIKLFKQRYHITPALFRRQCGAIANGEEQLAVAE